MFFNILFTLMLCVAATLPNGLTAASDLQHDSENNQSNTSSSSISSNSNSITDQQINQRILSASTLDVLYLVPEEEDSVYNLNEKDMLGNGVTNGWILPADEPITLNLYLYYDGTDEKKLNVYFHSSNKQTHSGSNQSAQSLLAPSRSKSPSQHQSEARALLYMYFTTNDLTCKELSNHQPLEIVEKLASNMYKLVMFISSFFVDTYTFDAE